LLVCCTRNTITQKVELTLQTEQPSQLHTVQEEFLDIGAMKLLISEDYKPQQQLSVKPLN